MSSACARDEEHHAAVDERNGLTVACASPQSCKEMSSSFNFEELHRSRAFFLYGFVRRQVWNAIFIYIFSLNKQTKTHNFPV